MATFYQSVVASVAFWHKSRSACDLMCHWVIAADRPRAERPWNHQARAPEECGRRGAASECGKRGRQESGGRRVQRERGGRRVRQESAAGESAAGEGGGRVRQERGGMRGAASECGGMITADDSNGASRRTVPTPRDDLATEPVLVATCFRAPDNSCRVTLTAWRDPTLRWPRTMARL